MTIAVDINSSVTQPIYWKTEFFSFGLIKIKRGLRSSEIFIPSHKNPPKFLSLKLFFFPFWQTEIQQLLYACCLTALQQNLEAWKGPLISSTQGQEAQPKRAWTSDLEQGPGLIWRLPVPKALQILNAGSLSFLPLSISSPEWFEKSGITIIILRTTIF